MPGPSSHHGMIKRGSLCQVKREKRGSFFKSREGKENPRDLGTGTVLLRKSQTRKNDQQGAVSRKRDCP